MTADYQTLLTTVIQKIHSSTDFADMVQSIQGEVLELLQADRMTIYQRKRTERALISKFKSGDDVNEIRVPLTTSSITGYVGMSIQPVMIKDVYDPKELTSIHEDLHFNPSFDRKTGFRTKSVLTVPILNQEVLLGVLQVLNKKDGSYFDQDDLKRAKELAEVLSQKFKYDLRGTNSPFEYLVVTNKLKQTDLDEYIARAAKENTSVPELLLNNAGVTASELGRSFEKYYQVPFQPYDSNLEIASKLIEGINKDFLYKSMWVPLAEDGDEVTILIDDPSDAQRILEIQRTLKGKQFSFKVGFPEDIKRFLGHSSSSSTGANIHDLVGKLSEEVEDLQSEIIEEVDENEATVIQLVNSLIVNAIEAGASDIHVEPGKGSANANVRLRIDGECRSSLTIPSTHIGAVVSRIKIMSSLDISERRRPQDGKCAVRFKGRPVELRVATVPTVNGESVVMRILASSEPLPISKLGLAERNLAEVERLVVRPHGLFLVVGPTGSGKTTTLHAILGHVNTPERKIWTAEDPVEITQQGLQQVQMKPQINLTFATALRAFLRADPDVIMIGEMRDHETAHIGVEASLTGHVVFSTLHTNSAAETVTRLLDLGLDPVSFSDALLGVLAQRLVRTLCKECKESYVLEQEEYDTIKRYYGEEFFDELGIKVGETELFQKGSGCSNCNNSGYRG
ncbi:MAG: Flp pilus assembly complex ATPase component TadA [Bdellovibrionales bacterium]|nr:Flp pilus assembly complex ATPase component TadA [Bdellovibrionales bacterium]